MLLNTPIFTFAILTALSFTVTASPPSSQTTTTARVRPTHATLPHPPGPIGTIVYTPTKNWNRHPAIQPPYMVQKCMESRYDNWCSDKPDFELEPFETWPTLKPCARIVENSCGGFMIRPDPNPGTRWSYHGRNGLEFCGEVVKDCAPALKT